MIKSCLASLILLLILHANSQVDYRIKKLLFKDDFSKPLNKNWIVEKEKSNTEIVEAKNGKLLLNTFNGTTVWYSKVLKGNISIKMKRKVIVDSGKNDRLSDCNFFWMATDGLQQKMFKRSGGFKEYDSLSMYYVGFGGNYNTTTRFRKYSTSGDKQLLGEFKDSLHLLQANKEYLIEIMMKNGLVQFLIDGVVFFSYKDEAPLTDGYFGIRSTKSRQEIDDVMISEIE